MIDAFGWSTVAARLCERFSHLESSVKTAPARFGSSLKPLIGAALLGLMAVSGAVAPAEAAPGFYVSGSSLKDANGNNFYPRGINNPHIWFDTDAYNALAGLASRKTNCIRIVWTTQGSAARLEQIIARCEALKMVPMVELHDATGSNDANLLNNQALYYTRSDVLAVLKRHERSLLINIANEWSNYTKTDYQWKEDYKRPITTLRNAGLTTTLVVDGPDYAQRASGVLTYGQELLNYDPQHNLLFSVHMYGAWPNAADVRSAISSFKSKNLPLVIGEFGYNYNNGGNNLGCKVDHLAVMQSCAQNGYGYIAWSTKGNGGGNEWLDLTTNWSTLNYWGNEIFNSANGISNSGQVASIFGGTVSSGGPVANGTYRLQNRASGKMVDNYGSTADGATVYQYDGGTSNNQRWTLTYSGGYYKLICVTGGKALDNLGNTGDGSVVGQYASGGSTNQQWTLVATGDGYYKIVNRSSGKCLDSGGATANGSPITQWGSSTSYNQHWKIQ